MVIYRPHKGYLDESMKEAREFDTFEEMINFIVEDWNKIWGVKWFTAEDVVIDEHIINDERIGWEDTRYVCVKRMGDEDYMKLYGGPQSIGMCATIYKR